MGKHRRDFKYLDEIQLPKRRIKNSTRIVGVGDDPEGGTCPSCFRKVRLRGDGCIRNHRIGTNWKNSYPCPGGGGRPHHQEENNHG